MKKILIMFITLISVFGLTTQVKASYAKCFYAERDDYDDFLYRSITIEINDGEISYELFIDESELLGQPHPTASIGYIKPHHLINNGQYYCPDVIYYYPQPGGSSVWDLGFADAPIDKHAGLRLEPENSEIYNDPGQVAPNPDIPPEEVVDPEDPENPGDSDSDDDREPQSDFWGYLGVIKCGTTEMPEPIPAITRILVTLIQIAAPIVLIIMGMIDIVQAVTASDEKKMKDSQMKFVRRLIPAVAIFLVITIFKLLIGLIADNATESESISKCIDCMISDANSCNVTETTDSD